VQNLAMLVVYCEQRFGKPIGIYTANWAWNHLPHENRFGHLPLWVANWSVPAGSTPPLPESWTRYAVHQYTSSGAVNGIAGNVDLNYAPTLDGIRKPTEPNTEQKLRAAVAAMKAELAKVERLVEEL
jgi:GH25 family lysozyme M1 (1,4-beta-N-acetylmuramidase)